jgi:hypothetical protein
MERETAAVIQAAWHAYAEEQRRVGEEMCASLEAMRRLFCSLTESSEAWLIGERRRIDAERARLKYRLRYVRHWRRPGRGRHGV